jgi:hypothetical protein
MKRTNLLSNQHPNLPSKKKIESGVDEQQPRGGFFSRMFSKKKKTDLDEATPEPVEDLPQRKWRMSRFRT